MIWILVVFLAYVIFVLFPVMVIKSRAGELVFKRWRLLSTPWLTVYVHRLYESDRDKDPHDHPWDYTTIILSGGYTEMIFGGESRTYRRGSVIAHRAEEAHQLALTEKPTTTLVFVGRYRRPEWGYHTKDGWVDFRSYRKNKNK
jgi:hypothetical protein